MKQYSAKVFDDFIMGGGTVYTAADFNTMLSMADQMCLQLVLDSMSSGTGNVGVRIETSNDGRNWTDVTAADVPNVAWTVSTATVSGFGYFLGTSQVLGNFVRLKLTCSTGNVHAVLYATGRGSQ